MTSHFLQLFKRGRYVSMRSLSAAEANKATREKKHEERERFSVAAVAFCFQYDKSFRAHFLKVAAGLSPCGTWSATVEPEQWGDLVIEGPRHLLVLEFKLGPLLQDHQSTEARIFSKSGYGAKIRGAFAKTEKQLHYIVIGKDFQPRDREGLPCTAVPWPKLVVRGRRESRLEGDLYNCLAQIGARAFLNRHMKKTKLSGDAKRAMDVYGTIEHVLAAEVIPRGPSDSDVGCLGLQFAKAGASPGTLHDKLVKAVKTKKRSLGWIGYEDEGDKLPHLSVWFYATAKSAPVIRTRLEGDKRLGSVYEGESSAIYIQLPGAKSTNDAEWFGKVLRTAAGC